MSSHGRTQTPGQAKSRARKVACRMRKKRFYETEAQRRGIEVDQVPFVLYREVQQRIREQAAENQRKLQEASRQRRPAYWW